MRAEAGLLAVLLLAAAGPAARHWRFVNRTGRPIDGIFVSEDGANAWGWSVIDPRTLAAGRSLDVRFTLHADDCRYDIRVTYQGGGADEWYNQADLCRADEIDFVLDRPTGTIVLLTR